jgi:hypothetical protein
MVWGTTNISLEQKSIGRLSILYFYQRFSVIEEMILAYIKAMIMKV